MGTSYRVSAALKAALAKAAARPEAEQDAIAGLIHARIAGEDWPEVAGSPWSRALASIPGFIRSILPKGDVARSVTLIFGSFILFVQAPMVLVMALLMVVETVVEASVRGSGGAARISQVSVGGSNRLTTQPAGTAGGGGGADRLPPEGGDVRGSDQDPPSIAGGGG